MGKVEKGRAKKRSRRSELTRENLLVKIKKDIEEKKQTTLC